MKVTKESIIGDILDHDIETARFFFEIGMHCLGCPASRGESIADACAVHGTNADELVEKINNGTPYTKDGIELVNKKDLIGFMRYATEEAKKLAEKGAMGAMVDDPIVFGWLMHYFQEDEIVGTLYNLDGSEY